MTELKKTPEHTVDRVFVLALLALFVAVAFILVFTGARQYRSIADGMTENFNERTIASYLREKMNQNDMEGAVSLTIIGDCQALALEEEANEAVFTTYIYCYGGSLYEITVSDGTDVLPGDGQEIMELQGLDIKMINPQLYEFSVTDALDRNYSIYAALNTKQ